MNSKGSVGLIAVIIILALIILSVYLVNVYTRECNNTNDCGAAAYCGSDYECHDYPDEIVVKERTFLPASIVLGISLIVAAYIMRKR